MAHGGPLKSRGEGRILKSLWIPAIGICSLGFALVFFLEKLCFLNVKQVRFSCGKAGALILFLCSGELLYSRAVLSFKEICKMVDCSLTSLENEQEIISESCSAIGRLIREFGIQPRDWAVMKLQSPLIWKRIEEIEWLGPQSLEVTRRNCETLIKNHERMFRRFSDSLQHPAA